MTDVGFNQPLYILPFDHYGPIKTKMFGLNDAVTIEQAAIITAIKQAVYDSIKTAVAAGVPKEKTGILVDGRFGVAILRDAAAQGYFTACPVEKSGKGEFDFEYGENFATHIERIRPTFCKALVRYNPEGDPDRNRRQLARLRRLSEYLHREGQSRFLFDLLVPAGQGQTGGLNGGREAYDQELRPRLTVQAIERLYDAQIEPDIWGVEGLDRREDYEVIVAAARSGGREKVNCIVVARGEGDQKARQWLATAAGVPGFVGFAADLKVFWYPLDDWRLDKIRRETAVAAIARAYREFVEIFENARVL